MLQWELQRCGCCTCSVVTCNITTYGSKCAHLCTNTHTHTHTHTPHTPQRGGQSQQVCQRQTPQLLRAVQPLLGPTCWSKMEWMWSLAKVPNFCSNHFSSLGARTITFCWGEERGGGGHGRDGVARPNDGWREPQRSILWSSKCFHRFQSSTLRTPVPFRELLPRESCVCD
jgi:hypothetical protein